MEKYVPYEDFAGFFVELVKKYSPDIKQVELAKLLNIGQGYVSKIMRGERLPTPETVERIKELWDIDLTDKIKEARNNKSQYSFGGVEEVHKKPFIDPKKIADSIIKSNTKPRLPVKVAAGQISEYYNGIYEDQCERVPLVNQFPSYDFTMIVQGNSMEPKFEGGDEIACKKVNKTIEWGKTYVVDTADGAFLKRLYDDDDCIRCVSYNDEYPDFRIDKNDIYGIYRVVGLMRFNI